MGLRRLGWAAVVLTALNLGLAVPAIAKTSARTLAQQALSENSAESAAAIAELRDLGPDGLQLFLAVHADRLRIRQGKAAEVVSPVAAQSWQRFHSVLDALCQQRDCHASRQIGRASCRERV